MTHDSGDLTPVSNSGLASIPQAIEAYKRGEFLIVVDDEDRENEGDLIIAADAMTDEKMAFMVRHTSGVICAPMNQDRADALRLPLMVAENTESMRTAFTVTVDVIAGTTTGISASDRTKTVNALANPIARAEEFNRPGHIFPLVARSGGVLKRAGHTEAGVDLCGMAGREPVGVLCEIVNEDGSMARLPDLLEFGKEHGLLTISIADLIRYRRRSEKLVEKFASARIPTKFGDFTAHAYRSLLDDEEHVAYQLGDVQGDEPLLVRCTPSASPAICSAASGATAVRNSTPHSRSSAKPAGEWCCTCEVTKVAASASPTSFALMSSRTKAPTPSKPTSPRVYPPTVASTASAPRSSPTSGSPR